MKNTNKKANLFAKALVAVLAIASISSRADFLSDVKSGATSAYRRAGKHKKKIGIALGTAAALGAAGYAGRKKIKGAASGLQELYGMHKEGRLTGTAQEIHDLKQKKRGFDNTLPGRGKRGVEVEFTSFKDIRPESNLIGYGLLTGADEGEDISLFDKPVKATNPF